MNASLQTDSERVTACGHSEIGRTKRFGSAQDVVTNIAL